MPCFRVICARNRPMRIVRVYKPDLYEIGIPGGAIMRVALVEVVTCTKWESRGVTMRVALEEVVPWETQEGAGREEQKESCR